MSETIKILNFVEPIAGAEDYCEEYYRTVHVPLIARTLREDPRWVSYYQNRLVAGYDALGGFSKRPDRWRLVLLRGVAEEAGGGRAFRPNNPELQRVVELDHPNFLSAITRLEAREVTVHDSLGAQSALNKYVVAFASAGEMASGRSAAVDEFMEAASSAVGCRLALVNQVIGEVESTTVGQAVVPSDRYVAVPTFHHVVELYFDNPFDARSFFASADVLERLHYGESRTEVFEAQESCGFDRR
ncbi:hypothetical protein OG884_37150 [Streptosporangium sp. NBC_01755]|uniref:hypothetical protein n=1 Tax=unclassified Streptosporangium TaxID=2632669 RepID=UPI002DDB2A88|nr:MULTISPECIES: hypothetical protein [unclassified Streptosporangium]WSA28198.1 hypothetical protein OIE13_10185 [Streptosporangium sp. NBC_01810]WSD00325.1 hypothetical protein OG884_37150 [Streptosporangium sp. NBC_01755]